MPNQRTVEIVVRLLQDAGAGRGLTVPEIRRLHPAGAVRRTAVLEALRLLEDLGLVAWNGERARWVGYIPDDARPLGVPYGRLARDLAAPPEERVRRAARLSEAFLRRSTA